MKIALGMLAAILLVGCEEKAPEAPKAEASPSPSSAWPSQGAGGGSTGGVIEPLTFDDDDEEDVFGSSGGRDEDCRRSDCPLGKVEITVDGRRNLEGRIGEAVRWDFEAEPGEYRDHKLVVYKIEPSPRPSQMNIRGNETDNARLDWIPAQNDPATGRITVSVRDMTACETVEDSKRDCEDFDRRERDYDTEETFSWRIEGATGDSSSGSSNSGNQLMIVMGLGALQGALNGQGIFNGALNGLSAMGGGLGGTNQSTQLSPLGALGSLTQQQPQPGGQVSPQTQPVGTQP